MTHPGFTDHWATAGINGQRIAWQAAAEFVENTDAGLEQVVRMMTAEVGHTPSEVVYEENKLEVRKYEPETVVHETPILFVYALVNRPYILDLQPDRSVIRALVEAGYEVYLIDWGEPSVIDRSLTLADYVCRYLDNCVDAVCEDAGVSDLHLVGYCMGGTMTVMYTALDDSKVRTLGLMATPLAFDETGGVLERWATHFNPELTVETLGNVPAELLAWEFSLMDPVDQYVTKYVRLYENLSDDDFVENFARMERWIWDGVDVAGETFREFVADVYKRNRVIDSELHLGGDRVDLADIEVPVLQIVGQYDHIVPAESSKPLHDEISSADDRLIEFPAGHIGISVSSRAHDSLWPDVADWFGARSPRDEQPDQTVRDGSSDGAGESGETAREAAGDETAGVDTGDETAGVDTGDETAGVDAGDETAGVDAGGDAVIGGEERETAGKEDGSQTSKGDDGGGPAEEVGADTTPSGDVAPSQTPCSPEEDSSEAAATVQTVSATAAAAVQGSTAGTPTDPTAEPDVGTRARDESVESVDGIGPTYAERLREAGVETRPVLAQYDAAELAAIAETSATRAEKWLRQVD